MIWLAQEYEPSYRTRLSVRSKEKVENELGFAFMAITSESTPP